MNRAYSILTVKAVEDGERVIRGIATTPTPDRMGDIVEPLGVQFRNPMPLLWQHQHDKPVGHVKFDKPTKDGITFEARLADIKEPGPLKDRIDEAWQSVKAGLVAAVSIGFKALEYAFMDNDGIRFSKTEVLELSLVTIPANAEAVITTIKSIDTDTRAALGIRDGDGRPVPPGASGKTTTHKTIDLRPKEAKTMNIAEMIAALENKRAASQARLEEIQNAAAARGETKSAQEREEFDNLKTEIKGIDAELADLRDLEAVKAAGAKPVTTAARSVGATGVVPEARVPATVRVQKKLGPGIGFARFARVKAIAKLDGERPRDVARALYGEDSDTFGLFEKAAVAAGTTAGWGAFLVGDETGVFADFAEYLRPQTILGRFGSGGIPGLRSVPFRTPLLSQTGAATGYWVGEGRGKPVTSMAGARTTLTPMKAATIAVVTEELLRDSSPSAEAWLRDELAAAIRERLDTDFIDPAKAAVTDISPASITNGVTPIASGGNTADDVRGDIQSLMEAFIADNNAPTTAVFVMPATVALALSLMKNPLGQTEFPGISINGGTLEGIPVITSEYVPTVTGGSYVALVNASDIYLADDGDVMVDLSREASLQMDNAPTMSSVTPTGTTVVSMFQTNSVAFRAERTINWARRRLSGVQLLSGVNWTSVPA